VGDDVDGGRADGDLAAFSTLTIRIVQHCMEVDLAGRTPVLLSGSV
jgi:hypothetical protein